MSHPVWVRGLKLLPHVAVKTFPASHPVWVRGLKHRCREGTALPHLVAPRVGAWIETDWLLLAGIFSQSHPVWVRGLKLAAFALLMELAMSHPVWVRGLKLPAALAAASTKGRTPCGCVD